MNNTTNFSFTKETAAEKLQELLYTLESFDNRTPLVELKQQLVALTDYFLTYDLFGEDKHRMLREILDSYRKELHEFTKLQHELAYQTSQVEYIVRNALEVIQSE